jgi:hypothetical protein
MSFYLQSYIRFRDASDKEQHNLFCKSRKKCDRDPGNDYISVRGRKHKPYAGACMACWLQGRLKKAREVKRKSKAYSSLFFDINGIVHKECVLASQAVISTYYCNVLRRLRQNVRRQKNWLLHHDNLILPFFTWELLTKYCLTDFPHPSHFSVSPIQDKTERPPF